MAKKKDVTEEVVADEVAVHKTKMKVKVNGGDADLLPKRKTAAAAGLDLVLAHNIVIREGEVQMVGTGVRAEIPEGHFGIVAMRSSVHDLTLTNGIGIIDSDYRGEIMLKLRGVNPITRRLAGERIAQLIILPYMGIEPELAEELTETERGDGGFGSTGK